MWWSKIKSWWSEKPQPDDTIIAPIEHKFPTHPLLNPHGIWRAPAPRLVVLTGAGLSVASGMQTFRGGQGLWDGENLSEVCNIHTWQDHRDKVHAFYDRLRQKAHRAKPNNGHHVLQRLGGNVVLVTQNVDGLLERAGKNPVLNVHGQLNRLHCVKCQHQWRVPWSYQWHSQPIERCPFCQASHSIKPGIVMFHEQPPLYKAVTTMIYELSPYDVVAVVGTSGEVLPLKNWLGFCSAHKWLFNLERSAKLPDHLFEQVHWGEFEKTSKVLEDLWQSHQEQMAEQIAERLRSEQDGSNDEDPSKSEKSK